jgi:hypothetical protein
LSNDPRIAYLSGSSYEFNDLVDVTRLERLSVQRRRSLEASYDYWAVHLRARSRDDSSLLDALPAWREIGRTANRKGDQVIVLVSPRRDDPSRNGPVAFERRPSDSCGICCGFGFAGAERAPR